MIALGLLFLTALYILLLGLVAVKFQGWARVVGIAILVGPLIYKTWDIPVGYVIFRQACEAESGMRVYEPQPRPAKVLRLEDLSSSDAAAYLKRYPALEAIEAVDEKVN